MPADYLHNHPQFSDLIGPEYVPHGTEVRLTPPPSEADSCALGRSAMPLTTRIESWNTRHASPSGVDRNWRNLFPPLSPWFVNLDSEPCCGEVVHLTRLRKSGYSRN